MPLDENHSVTHNFIKEGIGYWWEFYETIGACEFYDISCVYL